MGEKLRVAVVFGGRSAEHEVSLLTARSVLGALDRRRFEVLAVYIDESGRWLVGGGFAELVSSDASPEHVLMPPDPTSDALVPSRESNRDGLDVGARRPDIPQVDLIFPAMHGRGGEDGSLQGLLELADKAYVGSGVLGSAVGLDKIVMKQVLAGAGLPVVSFVAFSRTHWEREREQLVARIESELGYPCFTKFATSGSSIGTSKARDRDQLVRGIAEAAGYDRRLLVEGAVDAREIEVAVLGNDDPDASVCGEVVPHHEFYDYQSKYEEGRADLVIPADLPERTSGEIRRLALAAFRALDCAGMARVDFFLARDTGRVFVNEVNTIPGFTETSMYPKLWEASGLTYSELLSRLIDLGLERHADSRRNRMSIPRRFLEP